MNLHEYQSKNILKAFKIAVPNSIMVSTSNEVDFAYDQLKTKKIAIKTQVHAGGRGKSGGVKLINSKKEAHDFVEFWLGKNLITYQNLPQGQPVHRLLMEETVDIGLELYLSIVIDRQNEAITIICSSEGGTDIEELTQKKPQLIKKLNFKINQCLSDRDIKNFFCELKITNFVKDDFIQLIKNAIDTFKQNDLSLLEIGRAHV